jgi:O-antigen ligase
MSKAISRAIFLSTFAGFFFLGVVDTYAVSSVRNHAVTAVILILPLAAFAFPVAARQGLSRARDLANCFRWWQGLWFLSFISGQTWRIRDIHDISTAPVDSAAGFRIAVDAVVACILILRLTDRRHSWIASTLRGIVGVLSIYAFVGIISTIWSVFPIWSAYKSCEYLLDLAVLGAVLVEVRNTESYEAFLNWTWAIYGSLVVWIWMGVVIWPQFALKTGVGLLGVQLFGVIPAVHANSVGEFGGIIGVVACARLLLPGRAQTGRTWYVLLLLLSLATLAFAQTRSAMGGFALGLVLILFFSKRRAFSVFLGMAVGLLLSIGSVAGLVLAFLQRGQTQTQVETFTGRLQYWTLAVHKFLQRPLTGYGAYTGRFVVLSQLDLTTTASLHSDYFETLVSTGFEGLIPFLTALALTWWILLRSAQKLEMDSLERTLAVEALGVLAVLTVRSFFTTNLLWHPAIPFLVVVGYAEYLRRRMKVLRQSRRAI